MSKVIFNKEYDNEELADIERDVSAAFDPVFNPSILAITNGTEIQPGTFTVTIKWKKNV
jgi:hypothetical protein